MGPLILLALTLFTFLATPAAIPIYSLDAHGKIIARSPTWHLAAKRQNFPPLPTSGDDPFSTNPLLYAPPWSLPPLEPFQPPPGAPCYATLGRLSLGRPLPNQHCQVTTPGRFPPLVAAFCFGSLYLDRACGSGPPS
jgi:hypothetical protein